MGAVPKVRISKARKNRRRAHDGLSAPALAICQKCGQTKRPHFKCPHCGNYGAKKQVKAQSKKASNTKDKK
jgi:large subunit ribosomal protein L32